MERTADYWINGLKLLPHPEGGYYKESYRSDEVIPGHSLPERFSGERHHSTAIHYLLKNNECSKFHRIKSDEMWHYYDGRELIIFSIDEKGALSENKLGLDLSKGELPQVLIKAGHWFGAKLANADSYCLAGCTVSPGFHFDDFEIGSRANLQKLFPQHSKIIEELTV